MTHHPQLFESYESALKSCNSAGYEYPNLINIVVEKNKVFSRNININGHFDLASMRSVLAVSLALANKKIKVLDFGGGAGFHYLIARKVFDRDVAFDWRVIETAGMVEAASKVILSSELKFYDDLEAATNELSSCDLIIASSSLQYCQSPSITLRRLVNLGAKHLFITRTPFFLGTKTLITTQRSRIFDNGPGEPPPGYEDELIEYPITYMPKSEVEEIILSKYKIRFSLSEEKGELFFDGLPVNNYFGYFCDKS